MQILNAEKSYFLIYFFEIAMMSYAAFTRLPKCPLRRIQTLGLTVNCVKVKITQSDLKTCFIQVLFKSRQKTFETLCCSHFKAEV